MENISIRHAEPSDYLTVINVMDDWWGGRAVGELLPKLFFIHFRETSFVAEKEGQLIGFLTGFLSQTFTDEAYIHFVGVHPDFRQAGLGRTLYERFFEVMRQSGRRVVRSITSPVNKSSIAFHLRLGFKIEPQDAVRDGIPVSRNYDGRGGDRVLFIKKLA
jgi:ribosomal protein S18 acetylase RimI-like enzyme